MHIRLIVMAVILGFASPAMALSFNGPSSNAKANASANASASASVSVQSKNVNVNRNKNVNVNRNTNKQSQKQGQKQSLQARTGDIHIEGDDYEVAVSGASAPGLTSGGVSCMGSVSGGGQGMTFGFSIGTTYEDARCNARQEAAVLSQLGLGGAAVARMCAVDDVRVAMKLAGTPCPQEAIAAAELKASLATIDTSDYDNAE